MIFESGYRELDKQAKNSLASTDDDLHVPDWTEQVGAAFDASFYRIGSGISKVKAEKFKERNNQLAELMREQGYSEDDILSIHLNRPDTIPETMTREEYAATNPHYNINLYNEIEAQFSGKYKTDDEVLSEVSAIVKGEVSQAEQTLSKGDSLSALFVGTVGGAFTDPAVVATSLIPAFNMGNLAKSMSSVGQAIKEVGKIGAASASGEVLSIPLQKENAAFLGEDYGVWDAAQNIALAGTGGSILGAIGVSGLKAKEFVKKVIEGVEEAPIKIPEADDAAYTLKKALDAGLIETGEDVAKVLDEQEQALKKVDDWNEYNFAEIEEPVPIKTRTAIDEDQAELYGELLTPEDAARDAELFKQAESLDIEIPAGVKQSATGELEQMTINYKQAAKELAQEQDGLKAVALCMRGGA